MNDDNIREEIRNALKALNSLLPKLSTKELTFLLRYLKKLIE